MEPVKSYSENPALDAVISNIISPQDTENDRQELDLQAVTSHPISLAEVGESFTMEEKYLIMKKLDLDVNEDESDIPLTVTFMIEKILNLSAEEAIKILKETIEIHDDDINFSSDLMEEIKKIVASAESSGVHNKLENALGEKEVAIVNESEKYSEGNPPPYANLPNQGSESGLKFEDKDWQFRARVEAGMIHFWSPYQEVRSVTEPYDDPNENCETFRAYVISIIWQGIGTFINVYFFARQPAITFSSEVAQVFLLPSGRLWERVVPNWSIPIPYLGKVELNPGPWTQKEQLFASLIYFVAGLPNNVYKLVFVQRSHEYLFSSWSGWGYQILLGISSSFMGFGIAGLLRSLYVYPVTAMWPSMLPTVAVNKALTLPEKKELINGWRVSRYYFFFISFVVSFLYFWFPDYIFQAISYFSWMTWIAPDNVNLSAITGFNGGLGLNPISTFDFNNMWYWLPLVIPFFSFLLQFLGAIISFFIIVGMWYSNFKWTGYLPINAQSLYDNTGLTYNQTRVLTSDNRLNTTAYEEYSPPFYTAGYLMNLGSMFAVVPFVVTYVCVIHHKQIWVGFKRIKKTITSKHKSSYLNYNDPFCKMNSRYPEAPEWWFLVILVVSLVLAIVCVEIYPTDTPVWSIFFSLAFNIIFLVPFLQVYSTTGAYIALTDVMELISGYAIPGNGVALMIAALFGYAIDEQAQNYLTNQKIAHYGKVPPRAMFRGQILTTIINLIVTLAIINWQVSFPGICTPEQKNNFTCPYAQSEFITAFTWGIVGPKRVIENLYPILKWSFLIGFLIAFPCIAIKWYLPKKWTKFFEPNVIITGMFSWSPYNLSYWIPGFYWAFAFMYYIKNKYSAWWNKYNYILYSGVSAGIAFSAIIIFFSVQYNPKDINWWGNNVIATGVDGAGGAGRLNAADAPGGYFGPRFGSF